MCKKILLTVTVALLLFGCGKQSEQESIVQQKSTTLKYATGFTVSQTTDGILVNVTRPYQGATSGYTYLLIQKGSEVPAHDPNVTVIEVPVSSIVCTSTTHIPLLDYLEESDKLIGFPTLDYISSAKTRKLIDEGKIQELGIDKGMDIERIAVLHPDLVMGYTMTGDFGQFRKIEELGTPVVINAEYLEQHQLGRAEWIKFMALFFGKEKEADSVFAMIEKAYVETQALASGFETKPTVMSGVVYGDAWFLPGGDNYAAKLLQDAGYHYLWQNDSSNGFLELSFESVYEKAHDADYWIGVASFTTLKEIADADSRYTRFKPYKTEQVYTYNARKGAKGGSEFLELGYLRPDIILKDLVKIANPDVLPKHELYFHKQLE